MVGDDQVMLKRKLEHYKAIVERLLSAPEPQAAASSVPFAELCKEKITVLEDTVMCLDEEKDGQLLEEWRDNVVSLWKWYFTVIGSIQQKDVLEDVDELEFDDEDGSSEEQVDDEEVSEPFVGEEAKPRSRSGRHLYLSSLSSLNTNPAGEESLIGNGGDTVPLTPPQSEPSPAETFGPEGRFRGRRQQQGVTDEKRNGYARNRNGGGNRGPGGFRREGGRREVDRRDGGRPIRGRGPPNTTSSSASASASNGSESFHSEDICKEKEALRAQIRSLFAYAPEVDSNADIDSLKKLLVLVAKGAQLLAAVKWPMEESFQEEMLIPAFRRLPEEKQDAFAGECEAGRRLKRLSELKVFISETIGLHYRSLNGSIIEQKMRITWFGTGEPYCRYCRTFGHPIEDCPDVNNQECFKCFEKGHKAKHCTTRRCFNCGRPGHFARQCTSQPGGGGNRSGDSRDNRGDGGGRALPNGGGGEPRRRRSEPAREPIKSDAHIRVRAYTGPPMAAGPSNENRDNRGNHRPPRQQQERQQQRSPERRQRRDYPTRRSYLG